MSQILDWVGSARGRIADFGVQEAKSGAVGINLTVAVDSYFDKEVGEWVDSPIDDWEVTGTLWVIKKSGEINEMAASQLIEHAKWKNIEKTANGSWKPSPIGFTIEKESSEKYGDRYRIGFLNAYDYTPGGSGGILAPDRAKALASQYDAAFRALEGTIIRSMEVPADKPQAPAPPKPKSGLKPPARRELVTKGVGTGNAPDAEEDGSIPF